MHNKIFTYIRYERTQTPPQENHVQDDYTRN